MRKLMLGALLSSSSVMAVAAAPAVAQSESGVSDDVDTIIVTGRGRAETLVEQPISTTAYTAQVIEDARIDRIDDFIGLTPGVTIANAQDSGTNFITIRGMSQTRNGEPPVAVVVDGVLQVNSRSFDQALFDIESIEVLRGPQGALYGRNATNGAIIITTAGPTDEFEGYIQGTYGKGEEYGIEGSVSGPLIQDKVGYRLSARYSDLDGYFDNVALNDEVGFYEEFNIRGHLDFNLTENFTADLRASYTESDGDALLYTFQGVSTDPDTGEVNGFPGINDADVVQRDFSANNRGFDDREVGQVSLRWAYDLGWASLTSTSAYDWLEQSTGGDQFPYTANSTINPGISFFDGTQTQFIDVEAFSQELRLTSPDDQALRWMVGGYYLDTDRFISSTVGADLEQGIRAIERSPALGDPENPTTSFLADDNDNTAWALFFNFAYDVTDQFELSFAGRYDEDEREQTVSSLNGLYAADGTLIAPQGAPGAVNEKTFSRFQPKVTARYLFSDDASVFASWGRGFRSGQFNQNGVATAAANAGVVGVQDVYDQEDSETIEAGFKANLFGNLVRTSGAIYRTEVDNAPYFVFVGAVGAQVLVGIDEVEIIGGEFEVAVNPMPGLDIYAGVGVSDSEVEAYALNPAAEGNNAPYVPDTTFNTGVQYRTPITNSIGIFGRLDYERRGEQFWDPENSTARSAIDLLSLRAGLEDNDGRWSATSSFQNLTDEEYNSEWVLGGFAHAGLPRVWRVDLRVNF
ncbi:MAG: TonB-dependent receptor [Pseudomonadota bacterium]